jgi:hypothetical protein
MLQRYLKYWYGPSAAFSEHQPGDVIEYLEEGQKKWGTILWICPPRKLGNIYVGISYVVKSLSSGRLEKIFSANVLTPLES